MIYTRNTLSAHIVAGGCTDKAVSAADVAGQVWLVRHSLSGCIIFPNCVVVDRDGRLTKFSFGNVGFWQIFIGNSFIGVLRALQT